ncbi:50S ribosomal protein L13, partial [Candidatus Woesearchaeota archaeon CG10_big_fil_rev_8_21_14_0_10_47_5]
MIIIDANNLVLGRLAARAAKLCLMGEKVSIINCEKAVISGNKKQLLEKWRV